MAENTETGKSAEKGPVDVAGAPGQPAGSPSSPTATTATRTSADVKAAADKAAAGAAGDVTREAHERRVAEKQRELDNAVAAAKAASRPVITGFAAVPNGPFLIVGENLRAATGQSGDVKLNGSTANVTASRPTSVKGTMPVDVKPGRVRVQVGEASFDGTLV